ncbi:MAG TPA: PAS domain-containing protein, partial [Spirochaetales bacterium]|nr:PAS domain-containing protein [Spirochaetales bacterium]
PKNGPSLPEAFRGDANNAFALMRDALDALDFPILLLDAAGRVLDMNAAARAVDGDEAVGQACADLTECREGVRSEARCPVRESLASGRPSEVEYSRVEPDGRLGHFLVRAVPLRGPSGDVLSVVRIRRDVTSRKLMEVKLAQSEKMAAIGELSTYIAHEIRNPLFAIAGFANSLLRSPALDASAREKAEIIGRESRRLEGILKSILNFARPMDATPGEMDLNHLVRDTMAFLSLGCADNLHLALDLAPDLPLTRGVPDLLKQCLVNLVKNGLEAMPDGGRLTVGTRREGDMVALSVADTGRGIPLENRDKIFNPFFTTKDHGAGLGLAMTKKIMEEA